MMNFQDMHGHIRDIKVIRSRRRTIELQIRDGQVIVRAPVRCTDSEIERFVASKRRWLEKHLEKAESDRETAAEEGKLSDEDIKELARRAAVVIPERVRYYEPIIGVTCGRITIRMQKTRWGSCSSKGNLNFNCLLMLAPPQVLDSVVVHELCHLKEMNHSNRFYREVYRVFPEYDHWNGWLKERGGMLLARGFGNV